MTKNIEICKAEEVGAQVLDIRTTAERQAVAAINAAFGLAIPLPAAEPGEITELPAAVSAHDRQLLAQTLGKPEPAATLSTTDPLATFVATLTRELYRHFADRQAVYPLADFPAWFPHDDRNLAHLLQAVQSLAPRKISNGGATNDGIPDGISLAHLLCSPSAVTKILDDNHGWTYTDGGIAKLLTAFPNVTTLRLGMRNITGNGKQISNNSVLEGDIEFPDLETYGTPTADQQNGIIYGCPNVTGLIMRKMRSVSHYSRNDGDAQWAMIGNMANLQRIVFGKIETWTGSWTGSANFIIGCPKSLDLEFGQGSSASMNLKYWSPSYVLSDNPTGNDLVPSGSTCQTNLEQFLVNFRDHIALRLTDQGSGLTLTLSQAVRNAIHAAEATYGIEDIIVNQKHWTLSPAPSA